MVGVFSLMMLEDCWDKMEYLEGPLDDTATASSTTRQRVEEIVFFKKKYL